MVVNVDPKRVVDGCLRTRRPIREQGTSTQRREAAKHRPPRAADRSRVDMVCVLADKRFWLVARRQIHDVLPLAAIAKALTR
jgi:hypothetical protein